MRHVDLCAPFFQNSPYIRPYIGADVRPGNPHGEDCIHGGRDNGIWRRVKTIPFEISIPPNKRNPKLGEELLVELPGILNWALKGYQDWAKNGLREPPVISQAIADYRNEMDIIAQWLEDECMKDPTAAIKARQAYERFKLWCEQNGYSKPMTSANFYREFKAMFKCVKRNDGNYYLGVKSRYP